MGPGPREPHGLHSACPTSQLIGALQPPPSSSLGEQPGDWHPLSWPQPTWGHVPTSPSTVGGWLKGMGGAEFELGVSVGTPLQALLQAYLPTGLSTPGGQEEPLLPLVL